MTAVTEAEPATEAIVAELRRLIAAGLVGRITIHVGPKGPSSIEVSACGGASSGWRLPFGGDGAGPCVTSQP